MIPEKVVAARSEEMKFVKDRRTYEYYKMEGALETNMLPPPSGCEMC